VKRLRTGWLLVLGLPGGLVLGLLGLLLGFVFPHSLASIEQRRAQYQSRLFVEQGALLEGLDGGSSADPRGAPVPGWLGCRVGWAGGTGATRVQPSPCPAGDALPPALVQRLTTLREDALTQRQALGRLDIDVSWMAALSGHDDWTTATGTPLAARAGEPTSLKEGPAPRCQDVNALVMVRLIRAVDDGDVAAGVRDVEALLRAVGGLPMLMATDCSSGGAWFAHSSLKRAGLDADTAGLVELAQRRGVERRRVAAMVWHPWVDRAVREKVLERLTPFERCLAAIDGAAAIEYGALLDERYPGHRDAFEGWLRGPRGCSTPLTEDFAARSRAGNWKAMLGRDRFVTSDNWLWSFFVWSSRSYRANELEQVLEQTRPFTRPDTATHRE
jgi:hypothetical protein